MSNLLKRAFTTLVLFYFIFYDLFIGAVFYQITAHGTLLYLYFLPSYAFSNFNTTKVTL